MRRPHTVTRLGAALALAACVVWPRIEIAAQRTTLSSGALRDLASVSQLQTAFDADEGKTRVVLLLSPT